jgi:hypothetical protein
MRAAPECTGYGELWRFGEMMLMGDDRWRVAEADYIRDCG